MFLNLLAAKHSHLTSVNIVLNKARVTKLDYIIYIMLIIISGQM